MSNIFREREREREGEMNAPRSEMVRYAWAVGVQFRDPTVSHAQTVLVASKRRRGQRGGHGGRRWGRLERGHWRRRR
jgi:hypothetical protein